MIKISTKGRYGTRLMLQLALNYGNGTMLLSEIGRREELSIRYLEHLVRPLKNADLIHSERGAHGGYKLARKPADITLNEIIACLEGPLHPVHCLSAPDSCSRSATCVTHDIWKIIEEKIAETLTGITLEQLMIMHLNKIREPE